MTPALRRLTKYMAEEIKPVETQAQPAGSEQDYEVLLQEQKARTEKAEKDAANYRAGMLKYKNIVKSGAADEAEASVSELVQMEVQRAMAESTLAAEKLASEALTSKMARELKEAKLALNSKAGMNPSSMGSGEGAMPEVKAGFFSTDQIASLKARGFTDEMIKTAEKRAATQR